MPVLVLPPLPVVGVVVVPPPDFGATHCPFVMAKSGLVLEMGLSIFRHCQIRSPPHSHIHTGGDVWITGAGGASGVEASTGVVAASLADIATASHRGGAAADMDTLGATASLLQLIDGKRWWSRGDELEDAERGRDDEKRADTHADCYCWRTKGFLFVW